MKKWHSVPLKISIKTFSGSVTSESGRPRSSCRCLGGSAERRTGTALHRYHHVHQPCLEKKTMAVSPETKSIKRGGGSQCMQSFSCIDAPFQIGLRSVCVTSTFSALLFGLSWVSVAFLFDMSYRGWLFFIVIKHYFLMSALVPITQKRKKCN